MPDKILRFTLLTLILLILVPAGFVDAATKPPSLSISEPKSGQTITASEVTVKLSAKNAPIGALYEYTLDGDVITRGTNTQIKITGILSGSHSIGAEMLAPVTRLAKDNMESDRVRGCS